MISNHDRSGWFGASDTHYIMGNWNTKSFLTWWLSKMGVISSDYSNKYMKAGTYYEHAILDALGVNFRDRQIKIKKYRLRVNLDGETDDSVCEVKTYINENGFKMPQKYVRQVQVQMFASGKRKSQLIAYGLIAEDYDNYFNEIDMSRISEHDITYDSNFIDSYLIRLKYLKKCLLKKKIPRLEDVKCKAK